MMIQTQVKKDEKVLIYSKNFEAGSREKNLRWLEPYEGKLSRTVLRGGA